MSSYNWLRFQGLPIAQPTVHEGDAAANADVFRTQNLTILAVMLLPSPEPRFDLTLLLNQCQSSEGNSSGGFESLASCVAEDRRRADVLRESPRWALRCSDFDVFYLDQTLNECSADDDCWWMMLT